MIKRDVFYIAGYDPKGYRYYYNLFKKNLTLYERKNNCKYVLSKSNTSEKFPFWLVNFSEVSTKYTLLAWNDIVKKNWSENFKDALADCYSFFRIYTITGLFIKFGKESIYQLITGFYPFFYVLFSVLIALVLGGFSFYFSSFYLHFSIALVLSLLVIFFVNKFLFKFGKKLAVFWIARICSFCANWQNKKQGELDLRINEFKEEILSSLKANQNKENYELILIAHSVGTILCIELLETLLRENLEPTLLQKLKILTLGECIPLVSYQKTALEFRKKLEFVSTFDLKWYDYTSIIDGACFPQVDFFRTSGVEAKFTPPFLSTKFHTLYEKNKYKKIKKDKNKAHFLYLYDADFKGAYDFFNFVVGDKFLEEKIS